MAVSDGELDQTSLLSESSAEDAATPAVPQPTRGRRVKYRPKDPVYTSFCRKVDPATGEPHGPTGYLTRLCNKCSRDDLRAAGVAGY